VSVIPPARMLLGAQCAYRYHSQFVGIRRAWCVLAASTLPL